MKIFKNCKVKNCKNSSYWKDCGANGYCCKHYQQIYRNGKVLIRTKYELNEIIKYDSYSEICLYSGGGEQKEIARAKIDNEALAKIKKYKWCLLGNGYVMSTKKHLYLHHLIMGKKRGYDIDHINHNKLDNRKKNLRIVSRSQNMMNNKRRGYSWYKNRKKWEAYIQADGKFIKLGYFDLEQDAINARKLAEQKYFGEFAYRYN